jgi:hypothetical protein
MTGSGSGSGGHFGHRQRSGLPGQLGQEGRAREDRARTAARHSAEAPSTQASSFALVGCCRSEACRATRWRYGSFLSSGKACRMTKGGGGTTSPLRDSRFFELLLRFDEELATPATRRRPGIESTAGDAAVRLGRCRVSEGGMGPLGAGVVEDHRDALAQDRGRRSDPDAPWSFSTGVR